ncbi:uncharacterized protein LOC118403264 [Branchiostoma floridae]|nr:uncharacterized protein LOC118403264 [Branchiostoma floridae]
MFYKRSHDHKWKHNKSGMFRTDDQGRPVRPTGKPKLLLPVFETRQININNLATQKLPKWTPYLESPVETTQWNEFFQALKTASTSRPDRIRYALGDRAGWTLDRLAPCDPTELANREGDEAAIPDELDRLLAEEMESTEIVVRGTAFGARGRGERRGRPRGARGGGRGCPRGARGGGRGRPRGARGGGRGRGRC